MFPKYLMVPSERDLALPHAIARKAFSLILAAMPFVGSTANHSSEHDWALPYAVDYRAFSPNGAENIMHNE
ncbi:hypothetical protein AGMMS49525_16700 [Bacteroidia bacterium]|nr:hypothetical protein AGMMS49525_16700 [Bacteroidia bacterium]